MPELPSAGGFEQQFGSGLGERHEAQLIDDSAAAMKAAPRQSPAICRSDEWTEAFGSERLTGALLDRLTHHVHILEMNGESYRLKDSKRRRSEKPRS